MSLFNFELDTVTVTKELKELKPFKEIEKGEDSDSLFSYIFHIADWQSPYAKYNDEDRKKALINELLDGREPDETVEEAIKLYKELNTTQSLELLESARKAVRKLKQYFDESDPSFADDPDKAAKDLINNLGKVGSLLKNIEEWEEIILKEKEQNEVRKGVELNQFNR